MHTLKLLLIAFTLALGVSVAYRLSNESMAVVIGVICGVSATIPASLLVLFVVRRQAEQPRERREPVPPSPPVIVVQPPASQGWMGRSYSQIQAPPLPAPPRQWRIIGEEDE